MRRAMVGASAITAWMVFAGLGGCGVGTDCDFGLCAGPTADGSNEAGADSGVDAKVTPPDDSFALFVDGESGSDDNDGSRTKPFKKIATAIAKSASANKNAVYVCGAGVYLEHLHVTRAVSIHGGFACSTWAPDTNARPKVTPTDVGYALQIENVAEQITVSDLELAAADAGALKDGTSSIAVFVSKSKVTFLRTTITASNGAAGKAGKTGDVGVITSATDGSTNANGTPASGATGGLEKECTCSSSTTHTIGGSGGDNGKGGGVGGPSYGASPPNNGGAGAAGGGSCGTVSNGRTGADAPAAASAPKTSAHGDLDSNGWNSAKGADATENGEPGQGGGGGGAFNASNGGAGGGCGGCGGFAGKGGGGGGASIALLINEGTVALSSSSLSTKAGGVGGSGGAGGTGMAGGAPGAVGACAGGTGGRGADGGAGGGGAGGISVGILYKGTVPKVDTTSIDFGASGNGGKGGKSPDNDGPAGVQDKQVDAATL